MCLRVRAKIGLDAEMDGRVGAANQIRRDPQSSGGFGDLRESAERSSP